MSRLLNGLRLERDRLGLTQAELAHRVGVSRKTVNTIENLVFAPSALLALKLARALGRPVEAIFWIEGDAASGADQPRQHRDAPAAGE